MEIQVDGFQQKIELFRLLVQPQIGVTNSDKLIDLMAEYFDALSGGNFAAKVRGPDVARARLVYTTAADVVAHLRQTRPRPSFAMIAWFLIAAAGLVFLVHSSAHIAR